MAVQRVHRTLVTVFQHCMLEKSLADKEYNTFEFSSVVFKFELIREYMIFLSLSSPVHYLSCLTLPVPTIPFHTASFSPHHLHRHYLFYMMFLSISSPGSLFTLIVTTTYTLHTFDTCNNAVFAAVSPVMNSIPAAFGLHLSNCQLF
jgi:hypothetical protein